jgi:elongation factor 1-gamma
MAVAKYAGAPVELVNVDKDDSARTELVNKSQTGTFPYLETPHGTLSEAYAIIKYLLNNYNATMLGDSAFEKAQINQWVEFSHNELSRHHRAILYPILGFVEFDKDSSDKGLKEVKEFLKVVNAHLNGKKYLMGNKCTVADLELFFTVKMYCTLVFPEEIRKSLFPHITTWFVSIAAEPQMLAAYGRTLLCKVPQKSAKGLVKKEEPKKAAEAKKPAEAKKALDDGTEEKSQKKKANPLDLLPPPKLVLDDFKKLFLNSKDQAGVLKDNFWPNYDAKDYSIYWMKYDKLPSEGKILFRTSNSMSFFLQKLAEFRKYTFAAHGIYGVEGDYDIKGVWMWRGVGIPEEVFKFYK